MHLGQNALSSGKNEFYLVVYFFSKPYFDAFQIKHISWGGKNNAPDNRISKKLVVF